MKDHNYELKIKGTETEIDAKFFTEDAAKQFLIYCVTYAKLKDITFECRRVTPEPFSVINDLTTSSSTGQTSSITCTPNWKSD